MNDEVFVPITEDTLLTATSYLTVEYVNNVGFIDPQAQDKWEDISEQRKKYCLNEASHLVDNLGVYGGQKVDPNQLLGFPRKELDYSLGENEVIPKEVVKATLCLLSNIILGTYGKTIRRTQVGSILSEMYKGKDETGKARALMSKFFINTIDLGLTRAV